jgi:hypothetical protein
MLYSKLSEIAARADWPLMTVEYKALVVAAFVVAAVLIWDRIRIWKRIRLIETQLSKIETQLSKVQTKINTVLQIQVPLIRALNARSRVKIDLRDTAVEMGGGDVTELTMSPPTTPAQSESAKSAKLPGE